MIDFFPIPFLAGLVILAEILLILKRRGHSGIYLVLFSVFWLYLMVLAALVFFIPGTSRADVLVTPDQILSSVNLMPFDFSHTEVFPNLLLTLPLGFGISFFIRLRTPQIILFAILTGLGIETTQLFLNLALGSNYRYIDINDAMLNAIGVLGGYLFLQIIRKSRFQY